MADSVTVTLLNDEWTDVSAAAVNGLITNQSKYKQLVKEAVAKPADGDLTGHTLKSGPDGFYNWAGIPSTLWARALPNQLSGSTDAEVTRQ